MLSVKTMMFTLLCLTINQSIHQSGAFTIEPYHSTSTKWTKQPVRRSMSSSHHFSQADQSNNQSIDQSNKQSIMHTFEWHVPYDVNQLIELHESISDPKSSQYRQFLDSQSINQLIDQSINQSDKQAVLDWLIENDVNNQSIKQIDPSTFSITLPITQIEDVFHITMHEYHYSHDRSIDQSINRSIYRSDQSLTLPDRLTNSVRLIHMINDLPPEISKQSIIKQSSTASRSLTEVYDPNNQPDQAINQPVKQSIKQSINQSDRQFHTMSVDSQLLCSFSSGTHVTVTPQFIAQQYSFSPEQSIYRSINQTINQPNNQSNSQTNNQTFDQSTQVRLAVLGGALIADGPNGVAGASICEYYDSADLYKYANDLNYVINQTNIQSNNQTINWRPQFIQNDWASVNDRELQNPPNSGTPALEASLDIGAAYAFCPGCHIGLFPQPCDSTSFYSVFRTLRSQDANTRPHIISISYSYGSDLTAPHRDVTDTIFLQLGLMGVTVIVSSGDDGAVSHLNLGCYSDDGGPMWPEWPASSPYVTSVGATDWLRDITTQNAVSAGWFSTSHVSNKVCGDCRTGTGKYACQTRPNGESAVQLKVGTSLASDFTSGGGFSSYASLPNWQSTHVENYLDQCQSKNQSNNQTTPFCQLPSSSWYDRTHRAYPDVSFYGGFFAIGYMGYITTAVGTSLSSPGFAATLAHLTQKSLELTGKGLGFVNPMLYAMDTDARANQTINPSINQTINQTINSTMPFNDIVSGDNICPRVGTTRVTLDNCRTLCGGFYTSIGYDPVTGLGTPNLDVMMDMLPRYLTNEPFLIWNESSSTGGPSTGTEQSSSGMNGINGAVSTSILVAMFITILSSLIFV